MGDRVGPWRAIASTIADTLYEVAGYMLVRTTQAHSKGDTVLEVEGTHRWPDSGRIYVGQDSYDYTSKTETTLEGLTLHANPSLLGLSSDLRQGKVVTYYGRDQTDLDLIRQSFFVQYAEGSDLDLFGRNVGWHRPRGLSDTLYRELLMVVMYLDATTINSIEKIMNVVVGAGNYEVYEQLLANEYADHHKVFIDIDKPASDSYKGKTFMTPGQESHARTTALTIETTHTPNVVYGIYEATDPYRLGKNYIEDAQTGLTDAATPTLLNTAFSYFVAADEGKGVILDDNTHWKIIAYLSPIAVQLGNDVRSDANASSGDPFVVTIDQPYFTKWMKGHSLQIVASTNPANVQIATILEVVSPRQVQLDPATTAALSTDTAMSYRVMPSFSTDPSVGFRIARHTVVGNTITIPNPDFLPFVQYNISYTTIPSAQMCLDYTDDGVEQYPFYLFDDIWYVEDILDVITAAGVEPIVREVVT